MRVSTLLLIAPAVMALLTTDVARGQDNSTVSLQVSTANVAVGSFSYRALGVMGSKTAAPSALPSSTAVSGEELRPYPSPVSTRMM